MTITVTVTKRIATISATERIVAGNTYPVTFVLDSEWTGSLYARVRFGSQYYDIPFASTDTAVNVQMPVGYPEVGIGVFSEALEICSCEARIRLLRSILEAGEQVVEFDSDLYDQWAGEVSELLCDDAFDAESDRPVKNSVITAWKDIVPLDANLVHKTGAETVAGQKTFTDPTSWASASPNCRFVSTAGYNENGSKGAVRVFDQKDGSTSLHTALTFDTANGYNRIRAQVLAPDRASAQIVDLRAYSDHVAILGTPYYPVDGQGNPQALSADSLMFSGNVAVDPRLVHTTGNETIAGNKTFTGYLTARSSRPELSFWSTVENTTDAWKTYVRWADTKNGEASIYASLEGRANSDYTVQVLRLTKPDRSGAFVTEIKSLSDHMELSYPAYYPVDSQSNPVPLSNNLIMTSGNVAVDPRLVHTTGNETVAGNKTFTGVTFIDNPRFKRSNQTLHGNGEWVKFYEFLPVSYGGFAVIRVIQTYYVYGWIGAEIRIRQGTPTANPDAKFYNMAEVVGKLAKRASDGVVEVWIQNTTTNNLGVMADMMAESGGSMKVATAVSQTAPAVGDTYSVVVDIANA